MARFRKALALMIGMFVYLSIPMSIIIVPDTYGDVAGQWTKCEAKSGGEKWNIVYGVSSARVCQRLAYLCTKDKNVESTFYSHAVIINAPYKNCNQMYSSSPSSSNSKVTESFETNLNWVLVHEKRYQEIKDHLDMGEIDVIRHIFWTEQSHRSDNQATIRGKSDDDIVDALDRLGVTAEPDYLPTPAVFSEELWIHLGWCISHEGVPLFRNDGRKFRKPSMVKRECISHQSHNGTAQHIVNEATLSQVYGVMTKKHQDFRRNEELRCHFRWVAVHKGKQAAFKQLYNSGKYRNILAIFSTEQGHHPEYKHWAMQLSWEDLPWFITPKGGTNCPWM